MNTSETLTREIHQLEQLVDEQAEASEEAMSAEYQRGYQDALRAACVEGDPALAAEIARLHGQISIARSALKASQRFLHLLKNRGYEWPGAFDMGAAVINHCEIALAHLSVAQPPAVVGEESK